jgi:MarR family transcriptional regulator, organic hydroperoxide resistance regulator
VKNERYIVYFISSTRKKMNKFIESQIKEKEIEGLIPSHGNILTNLYDYQDRMTMKEIARRIGRDKSTVTALVNKLEKLGFLTKVDSEDDHRTVYLELTEKGNQMEQKYRKISEEVVARAYTGFSEEEKSELLRLLKKLNNNFDVADKNE